MTWLAGGGRVVVVRCAGVDVQWWIAGWVNAGGWLGLQIGVWSAGWLVGGIGVTGVNDRLLDGWAQRVHGTN